jgi:ppGpp synthetase/RelA/SpoT-type nucleotidyltranferase
MAKTKAPKGGLSLDRAAASNKRKASVTKGTEDAQSLVTQPEPYDWDREEHRIREHYRLYQPELESLREYLTKRCLQSPEVHSVRSRVKDEDHLIEKIKRKYEKDQLTAENYTDKVEDLVGLRLIHLYKHDWKAVHAFLVENFVVSEKRAYLRVGDDPRWGTEFLDAGLEVADNKGAGYRSVHYVVTSKPGKTELKAEIQVRTLFEEGWSEIDHRVNYPNVNDDIVVGEFLKVFNRIVGGIDEMAELLGSLVRTLESQRAVHESALRLKDEEIAGLRKSIGELPIKEEEKAVLSKYVDRAFEIDRSTQPRVFFGRGSTGLESGSGVTARVRAALDNQQSVMRLASGKADYEKLLTASLTNAKSEADLAVRKAVLTDYEKKTRAASLATLSESKAAVGDSTKEEQGSPD